MNNDNILSSLKQEKKELEQKLSRVNKAILALEPIPVQYMQWRVKAMECIREKSKYIQTSEILECVMGKIEEKDLRRKYINALSVALNYMCKDGELKKFSLRKRKGDFYGFPEWFDKHGLPTKDRIELLLNLAGRNVEEVLRA